jgi:hypothetical protein
MCQSAWQTFWQPVLHGHPRLVTNMVPLSFRSASRSLSDRSRARWSRSCLGRWLPDQSTCDWAAEERQRVTEKMASGKHCKWKSMERPRKVTDPGCYYFIRF